MREDRLEVLVTWVATRVGVLLAAWYASWVLAGAPGVFIGSASETGPAGTLVELWRRWDVDWYASIAISGYGAPGFENNLAFLPALPAFMRSGFALGVEPTLTGLVVSLVAGAIAALSLGRLTRDAGGRPAAAVLAWTLAPMAVFLFAPYAEALFCAFAFGALMQARHRQWLAAGVLAVGAVLTRPNGIFLALALIVALFTTDRRRWVRGWPLLLPFAAVGLFVVFLQMQTGSWTAWFDAQAAGWNRHFTSPWDALQRTWQLGFTDGLTGSFAVQYRFEIMAMIVMLVFGLILLIKRWWTDATFVLLTAAALATSTEWYSVPRSLLTLAPIWVLLGVWMTRHRWLGIAYCTVMGPLMVVGVIGFTQGRWIA